MTIVDLFAGCGGWDEGAKGLGIRPVGVERDPWACRTAAAAGHLTIRSDVEAMRVPPLAGLIASPPCQAFSSAGKGEGREHVQALVDAASAGVLRPDLPEKVRLVLEPTRWLREGDPEWVCMEQVPAVLPIWEGYARWLETAGWSTWTGVLNAADFGVPQTRRRAFLIASRVRTVAAPEPTHAEHPQPTLFGVAPARWVSMADALGWTGEVDRRTNSRGPGGTQVPTVNVPAHRPAPMLAQPEKWVLRGNNTVAGGPLAERGSDQPAMTVGSRADLWEIERVRGQGMLERHGERRHHPVTEPSPTLAGDGSCRTGLRLHTGPDQARPLTIDEALVLQSFPCDYPVQGPKSARFLQVGNAVPVKLATAVLEATS